MLEWEWKHKHGWEGLTSWQRSEGGESLAVSKEVVEQRQRRFRGPDPEREPRAGPLWRATEASSRLRPGRCRHPEPLLSVLTEEEERLISCSQHLALCELVSHTVIVLRANNSDREWNSSKVFPVPADSA